MQRWTSALALFLYLMTTVRQHSAAVAAPSPSPSSTAGPPPPSVTALYSRRAIRQAQAMLRLRLLELRAENLARVRAAVERDLLEREAAAGPAASIPPRQAQSAK